MAKGFMNAPHVEPAVELSRLMEMLMSVEYMLKAITHKLESIESTLRKR
jgi:hypothetical protein